MNTEILIDNLKEAVAADPRSQTAIESDAGMATGKLSRLLNGKIADPSFNYLAGLAGALGTTVGALIGEAPAPGAATNGHTGPAALAAETIGVHLLSHAQIVSSPLNPRHVFDPEKLAELANSIAEGGLDTPLLVDAVPVGDHVFAIVAGERRWRAIGALIEDGRWPADRVIHCIPKSVDQDTHLAKALVENLQREDLTPLEEARAFADLRDKHGWDTAKIASTIGKTARHAQLRLELVDKLAKPVQQALHNGEISTAQARALTPAPAKLQTAILKTIKTGESDSEVKTAFGVRAALRDRMLPVDKAFFDAEASGLDIVEFEDGKRYFADAAAFGAAQVIAAEAEVKRLGKKWACAELVKGYFSRYSYEESDDRKTAGAFVVMDQYQHTVKVYEGLVKQGEYQENPENKKRRAEREAATKAKKQAREKFRAAIIEGLAGRRDLVLRGLVMKLMADQGPLEGYADGTDIAGDVWEKTLGLDDEKNDEDAWRVLRRLDDEAIEGVLFKLAAACFSTAIEWHGPDIYDVDLAEQLGVDIPDILRPEAEEEDGDDG